MLSTEQARQPTSVSCPSLSDPIQASELFAMTMGVALAS